MDDVEQSIASHLEVDGELDDIKGALEDGTKPISDKSAPKSEPKSEKDAS